MLDQHGESVSKLFYRHYDFLPRRVLDALVLLEVCLRNPTDGPYALDGDAIIPTDEPQTVRMITDCTHFQNSRYLAAFALGSKNDTVRGIQAIKLHARHVLINMNRHASIGELLSMVRKLQKAG